MMIISMLSLNMAADSRALGAYNYRLRLRTLDDKFGREGAYQSPRMEYYYYYYSYSSHLEFGASSLLARLIILSNSVMQ